MLLLGGVQNSLPAQTTITPEQFLAQQLAASENLSTSPTSENTFTPSWIENIDFRTETREFDLKEQRYLLRASPNSPKVRKAQKQLYELYQQRATLANSSVVERTVEEAYQQLIDAYEQYQSLQLKQEKLVLLEDQEIVLSKLSRINTRYGEDWLEIIADIQEVQIELASHQTQLQQLLPSTQKIDWSNWISIASISNNLQKKTTSVSSSKNEKWRIEQQLIDSEIALEEAEADKVFDFLQIEYQGRATESFEDKVSLTASFQFPFSSNRQLKIEELLIEKEMLAQEQLIKTQLTRQTEQEKKQQLLYQIQQWHLSNKLLKELKEKSQQILQFLEYQTKEGPLAGLVHQVLLKEKEEDILDLEIDIYKDFLEYLTLTRDIYRTPYLAFSSSE